MKWLKGIAVSEDKGQKQGEWGHYQKKIQQKKNPIEHKTIFAKSKEIKECGRVVLQWWMGLLKNTSMPFPDF